jgi:hypothetical protein
MQIQIETGPELRRAIQEIGQAADDLRQAVNDGLLTGGHYAAGTVVSSYMTGQSLKRGTGLLAQNVTAWSDGDMQVAIGVPDGSPVDHYKWILGDDIKTIIPKRAKYLTIPIGDNLSAGGVPKYKSPRDVPDGFFFKSKAGNLLFGHRLGKTSKARIRPLFVLKKSVTVIGSGALPDGVMDSIDDIALAIQDSLDRIGGLS